MILGEIWRSHIKESVDDNLTTFGKMTKTGHFGDFWILVTQDVWMWDFVNLVESVDKESVDDNWPGLVNFDQNGDFGHFGEILLKKWEFRVLEGLGIS